jgi:hypothetical protein
MVFHETNLFRSSNQWWQDIEADGDKKVKGRGNDVFLRVRAIFAKRDPKLQANPATGTSLKTARTGRAVMKPSIPVVPMFVVSVVEQSTWIVIPGALASRRVQFVVWIPCVKVTTVWKVSARRGENCIIVYMIPLRSLLLLK